MLFYPIIWKDYAILSIQLSGTLPKTLTMSCISPLNPIHPLTAPFLSIFPFRSLLAIFVRRRNIHAHLENRMGSLSNDVNVKCRRIESYKIQFRCNGDAGDPNIYIYRSDLAVMQLKPMLWVQSERNYISLFEKLVTLQKKRPTHLTKYAELFISVNRHFIVVNTCSNDSDCSFTLPIEVFSHSSI